MIGRTEEARLLKDIARQDRSQFVVVYGRRRVGKTFLVRETFDYRFAFTHTGMESASMETQLASFHEDLLDQGAETSPRPKSWLEAFSLLKKFLKSRPEGRKVIFLDELPWMDTPKSGFVPALENFWNGWCSARRDILLVACGSATSWMAKKILRNKGGLFNRAGRTIFLEPFTLGQCEEFVREQGLAMDRREITEGYMAFGGSPYYWSLLDPRRSMAQNIDRMCFSASGELVPEFKRLYASVFNRPERFLKIVSALAERQCGLTRAEISVATGLPETGLLTDALEDLELSGFIRRFEPIGAKKKGTVFQLMDCFTLFHLRFMAGRPAARGGFWTTSVDTPACAAWEGLAFERVCFWHEEQIKAALGISGVSSTVCAWRGHGEGGAPRAQIDMLIDRRDGVVNVCEIKFSSVPFSIDARYAESLRNKIATFKEAAAPRKSVHLTFITAEGLKRNSHSGMVQSEVTLDDLFRPPEPR